MEYQVRKYRVMRGMTQGELAQCSGLSRQYINMLERNSETNMSVNTLIKLSKILKCTPSLLIGETPEPKEEAQRRINEENDCFKKMVLSGQDIDEIDVHEYIIRNWSCLFPNWDYVGHEIPINGLGRIDILGKEKESVGKRDVIIEVKTKNHNPTQQVCAYGIAFENPILVGVCSNYPSALYEKVKYILIKDLLL